MNPAKRASRLQRRSLKFDTTLAGKRGFCHVLDFHFNENSIRAHLFLPCLYRSADIALVAGGNRKRWIIATENMQAGDVIKTSGVIGRMAGGRATPRFLFNPVKLH